MRGGGRGSNAAASGFFLMMCYCCGSRNGLCGAVRSRICFLQIFVLFFLYTCVMCMVGSNRNLGVETCVRIFCLS